MATPSPDAAIALLKTGQVAAAVLDHPMGLDLQDRGDARILLRFGDIVQNLHSNVMFARDDILRTKPETVRTFLRAWFETVAYARSHRAESVKIFSDVIGKSPENIDRSYDALMQMYSDTGRFEPAALEALGQSFVALGLVDKAPDMRALYTEEFLPR